MEELSEAQVRQALGNCSRSERAALVLPDLHAVQWDQLDVLGWRDPRAPLRAALVVPTQDGPRGVLLRAPETRVRRTAQCLLCHTVQRDAVALFVARRAGAAGRNGSTVGTYICADLACSLTIRIAPPAYEMQPDPAEIVGRRIEVLRTRLGAFTDTVLAD